jgi:predicted patatin/cPLA2 family phospholipase
VKIGLVLEGGAVRTVYSCGVTDALLAKDFIADYVIGTSGGVAYGTSYCSRQPGRNLEVIKTYANSYKYMSFRNLINPKNKSYFGLDFVYETIPNELIPFDYEAFAKFKGDVIATVTDVETGKPDYLKVPRHDKHNTVLKATCALPMLSPIIMYHGKGYLDGGISDSIPFKKAFEDGCDKVIVVLTRHKGYIKKQESVLKATLTHYRHYPELCDALISRPDNYNQQVAEAEALEREGKLFIFRPDNTDGFKRNEKDLDKIQALYDDGYKDVFDRYDELMRFIDSDLPSKGI